MTIKEEEEDVSISLLSRFSLTFYVKKSWKQEKCENVKKLVYNLFQGAKKKQRFLSICLIINVWEYEN